MTVKLRGYIEKLNLRKSEFTKALDEALAVQVRQAARAFLRAAILKVPVYTGMARGAFQPLGRYLRVAIPINVDPQVRKKYPKRNPEAGAAQGAFDFVDVKGSHRMQLHIGLAHFIINEFYPARGTDGVPESGKLKNPVPWESFEAGRQAFRQYLRENLARKVPSIKKFVTRTRVNFDG